MKIIYSSNFERNYKKLPERIKDKAEKKEKIFRENPFDQRLDTHKLKGKLRGLCSFSIDQEHRIVFEFIDSKNVIFHATGSHSIYR